MSKEAMQQAIDALRNVKWYEGPRRWVADADELDAAIEALHKALAQPAQQPTAWIYKPNNDLLWPHEVEARNPLEISEYVPLLTRSTP